MDQKDISGVFDIIKGKRILFVTTKNIDYIRNTQELRIVMNQADSVTIISSEKTKYVARILAVWKDLLKCNMKNFDVVFIGFLPQLVVPFFYYKMKNKDIIIDFFISLYDTLIHDRKKYREQGIVARVCHLLDEYTISKACNIITDTKVDAQYFFKEFNGNKNKFETLYLEADMEIYYPREKRKCFELENKFVVLYFGSILPLQGVDIVLDAVRLLCEKTDIYFQIIGPICDKYDKPIQKNVEYINWLNQNELAEYIANADLCLAGHFAKDIEKAKRTIPGKAYIYQAMRKPMILGDNLANRELFMESDQFIYIEMGNSVILKEKIIEKSKLGT